MITGILAVILLLSLFTRINRVLLFWLAFILTRPFGATFGDVLTKSPDKGGWDFGRGYASLILLAILVVTLVVAPRLNREKGDDLAPIAAKSG